MSGTEKSLAPDNVWVLGYDRETNECADFAYCPRAYAMAQIILFEGRGLRVEFVEPDEMERRTAGGTRRQP